MFSPGQPVAPPLFFGVRGENRSCGFGETTGCELKCRRMIALVGRFKIVRGRCLVGIPGLSELEFPGSAFDRFRCNCARRTGEL